MPLFTGGDYIKLGHRKALEIAIVAVASVIILDLSKKIIRDAKVILSAVAPKAIHAISAEQALRGEKPTIGLIEVAASLAMADCKPISDIRGGSEYRKEMVKVLTKRTLVNALEEATGEKYV
jgi:carbon-monoxide dehydrogenase medium subunit